MIGHSNHDKNNFSDVAFLICCVILHIKEPSSVVIGDLVFILIPSVYMNNTDNADMILMTLCDVVQQFGARSHAREYTDISGPSSSYYSRRTNTIEYGHGGMKSVSDDNRVKTDSWSSGPFIEQRQYSTEKHHTADKPKVAPLEIGADQPSKVVAVEKAMEMAQRTREIISKLGGLKQVSQQSEGSVPFTDSSLQSETKLSEKNASAATDASESSTLSKIRQNTSLVKYAFNLPVEAEHVNRNESSVPRPDVIYSWTDGEHKYGNAFEAPIPDQSHERTSYAVTRATASGSSEGDIAAYSQENTWNVSPKVTQEPAKTESCDPTIANILKSIGFNFEMSSMMQDKARKETSSVSHTESSVQASRVPSLYKEKAERYHAEQMRQYSTVPKPDNEESLHLHGTIDSSANKSTPHTLQHGHDDKPFAEDMFKQSPVDFKLKFKASDSNADKKSGTLYEDFSDSDDDFSVTAKTDASIVNKPATGIAAQSVHSTSAFGHEGMPQQVTANKTADDLDWEFSTEAFIRKLQQPRSQQRTVTVVPKSEPAGRSAAMPAVQGGHVESPNDNVKMTQSFVPLEELKTIKKTIIVSESSAKTESGAGKSESSSSTKNKDSSEKTFKQRNEGSSKYMEKASTDSSHKKNRRSEPDDDDDGDDDTPTNSSKVAKPDTNSGGTTSKERQKRIDSLLKELENLKRQQNILMRRKKREKDAHRDPFLMENSKLQEEICNQIDKLRKASQQTVVNSESQVCDAFSMALYLRYEHCCLPTPSF